jgi:hypothetical protein
MDSQSETRELKKRSMPEVDTCHTDLDRKLYGHAIVRHTVAPIQALVDLSQSMLLERRADRLG